jgi:uroporphyrinogen decarboxylase
LVKTLGLPPRRPRVYDTGQMLALPEPDVLDALGADCVMVEDEVTNAFPQPELWHDYDFGGRLAAQVRFPEHYRVESDGTVVQQGTLRMPPAAHVFDSEHAGQPLDLLADIPQPSLEGHRAHCEGRKLTAAQAAPLAAHCRRVREASRDRAVFANLGPLGAGLSIGGWGGIGVYPLLCVLEPELIAGIHALSVERCMHNLRVVLPLIRDSIDVLMFCADDWGTQASLIASPEVYRTLFLPYYREVNALAHALAPNLKTFLHSCGALYPIIGDIADCGFDILNPVQWSAGGHSPAEWKAAAAGRIAFWGGGVNAQATLPLGSVQGVVDEVRRTVSELSAGGGYVFCNTHNILAEIAPEKVVAMYRTARELALR